jgi:hypothetical protein
VAASVSATGAATIAKSSLAAGTYRFVVGDRSAKHNFHLSGPGVNRLTGIAFVGTAKWVVVLKRGVYRYGSDRAKPPKKTLTVR